MVKKIAKSSGIPLKQAKHISRDATPMPSALATINTSMVATSFPGGVPFSEFDERGNVRVDDIIVGLRNSENSQFFLGEGLLDANDNFIIGYSSVGADAVNYINFENAITGDAPVMAPQGVDGNIPITIRSKNDAPVNVYTQDNYFNLNDTSPIYGVMIDGTFTVNATDIYVPSALAVKTYVDSTFALVDPTFVTNTDERYRLPFSQPLSILATGFATVTTTTGIMGTRIHTGTANQVTVTNGSGAAGNPTYSLPSTLIAPGTFKTTSTLQIGSGATVSSISTDGTLAANSDTLAVTQKAVKTYVDTTGTAISSYSYITKTDNTANLPNSTPLSGLATGFLSNTTITGVLNPRTITGTANQIDFANGTGAAGNPTASLSSTLIAPGTFQATTSVNIGGAGATVTSISTDGSLAANSDTLTVTQKAVKTYVDAASAALSGPTYITNTNYISTLPNSQPLSALATGIMAVTTTTGIVSAVTLTGTANQVTVTGGNGAATPTFSLPSALILPGTLTLGGDVDILAHKITSSTGVINLTPLEGFRVEVDATNLSVRDAINKMSQTGNKIVFGSSVQSFQPASSTTRFQVQVAGISVDTGVTVNDFSDDTTMAGDSSTALVTEHAAKTYSDTVGGGSVTLTNAGVAGGTTSLVNDGIGPALAVKGLVGSTNISVTTNTTDTTISLTGTISVTNALTMNNSGAGAASGSTFNGSSAVTISYNSVGASPLAGSSSLVTVGTITSGTWNGTTIAIANGGTNATAAIGASGTIAQSDGTKYTFTTATYPATATGTGKILRADGTNWVASTPTFPNTANTGKILIGDGTNWVETTAQYPTTAGTIGNVLTSDGTNWVSSAPAGGASSYGYIHMNTGNWTGQNFAFTTAYQELTSIGTNFTLAANAVDFAMTTDGRLKYTGTPTINIVVNAQMTVVTASGNFSIQIYKNGSAVTDGESYVGNHAQPTVAGLNVASIATNDYISIFAKRSANSTIAILNIYLSVQSV